jgi:hypothetical protein
MYFIIIFNVLMFIPCTTKADCLGCVKEHTEYFETGAKQQCYLKKCLAKQKDINSETCPKCNCSRDQHSIHRHPYKWYNGKKLPEHNLGTITRTPQEQTNTQTHKTGSKQNSHQQQKQYIQKQ